MQTILFYCLICLHHFYLGFEDATLFQQRDDACNGCVNRLLNRPEFNPFDSLGLTGKITRENQLAFDYRLLPIFRRTIEENIQTAFEMTDPYNGKLLMSDGDNLQGTIRKKMFENIFDVLREVYLYEKNIKESLEEQKNLVLKEVEQKVVSYKLDNIVQTTHLDELSRKMEIVASMIQGQRLFAKEQAEKLVVEERIKMMKESSKLISVLYTYYLTFNKTKDLEGLENPQSPWNQSMKTLKEKLSA